ncbi:F0F1 ATP synthase subunit delta [Listeria riparia FSL S10-1204]|uniref:F0F1 ATP synthase subunit delta n=1 Tax=Listeria riparia FSL S10-1204 TaxID=1265816 RepID=W7DKI2_9LIST|nr:F0F1 ATP synthase subunit delta [Listeria riparia]EUJ45868.1 F0F1 ATP synthase subunit delta [Listeria riparia FSL S10-1204]
MSKDLEVANRYALALFEVAKDKQMINQFDAELAIVKESLDQSDDFRSLIENPTITIEAKKQNAGYRFWRNNTSITRFHVSSC